MVFSTWLPLQVSIVTVFLFAGPHNWFEFRYFLTRLPLRFGKSRNFFLTAFAGIGVLTSLYLCLPLLFRFVTWTEEGWAMIIASWNSLLLGWLVLLIWLRSKQKKRVDWAWIAPVLLAIGALNWLAPLFFSLAIVYLHPLVALWFLDRHLSRTRPDWLRSYRRFLCLLPMLIGILIWSLSKTTSLPDDNGLFWRITQHSGSELLPSISSHMLVSVHLFLEMLHYGVWLLALPLIAPIAIVATSKSRPRKIWNVMNVPLARHPRGFPRLIAGLLIIAAVLVVVLWLGFSLDYETTRDVYFTVAIAHVLAEAPFLLRML
jgi:membrane protein CcdC involved in cytochrome C biogenesis